MCKFVVNTGPARGLLEFSIYGWVRSPMWEDIIALAGLPLANVIQSYIWGPFQLR